MTFSKSTDSIPASGAAFHARYVRIAAVRWSFELSVLVWRKNPQHELHFRTIQHSTHRHIAPWYCVHLALVFARPRRNACWRRRRVRLDVARHVLQQCPTPETPPLDDSTLRVCLKMCYNPKYGHFKRDDWPSALSDGGFLYGGYPQIIQVDWGLPIFGPPPNHHK